MNHLREHKSSNVKVFQPVSSANFRRPDKYFKPQSRSIADLQQEQKGRFSCMYFYLLFL